MIGARISPEKFEQFLRERYYLEVELKNVNELKSGNIESKNGVQGQRLLNGLFIMRLLHDPYFSLYVCKRIEQENLDLKDVLAYIQYIILEKHLRDHPLFASSNPSADPKSPGNLFSSEPEDDRTIDELIKTLSHSVELSNFRDNDYYWKLYTQASRDEEGDLLDALKSIQDIDRWISVRWQEDSLFSWGGVHDHYSEGLTNYSKKHSGKDCAEEDDWSRLIYEQEKKRVLACSETGNFRLQTMFLYENIKPYFRQLYAGDKKNISAPFFAFLNIRSEFIFEVKNLLEKYGFVGGHEDRNISKFLKFYMDSVFISQLFWFKALGENQKIELLNRYCDDLDISISGTNLNLFGKESLLHCLAYNEARKLYEERDYESSIRIFDTVLKNTDYQYLKYLCTSWIAEIYQESNEYPLSLNYFEQAYSIASSFTSSTRVSNTLRKFTRIFGSFREGRFVKLCTEPCFVRHLELSNMAVMYCHLKNKHKANECFGKLNQELKGFSIPKRILILYELASYFSGHQDLLKFRFLHMLVMLSDSYEDNMVDTIEEDMNEKVFALLGLKDDWTREKCAQEWVVHMKSCALKCISDIGTTLPLPSDLLDKGWADLVTVYEDGRYLQCKPSEKREKILMILEASDVRSKVFDAYPVTPNTFEPRKSIIRLENTIKELEKIEGKENTKFETYREVLELHDVVQRLRLECSKCCYVLDDFERAERILREVLNDSGEEEVLFRAHCLLGLVLIKTWDVRSGIRELERALDLSSSEETFYDRCRDLFEIFRDELICFQHKDIFYDVLHFIIDKVNSTIKNEDEYRKNGHVMAVEQLNDFGLIVEAGHLIERGLSIEKNELVKVALLEEKAYLRYLEGDFAESEAILNEIVSASLRGQNDSVEYLFFCSSAWHKISVLYARKSEFKKAYELIEFAISKLKKYNNLKGIHDSDWKLKRYEELKKIYEIFSKDVLILSKINNKKVIDLFNTAEEIVLDGVQQRKNRDFDFSLSFVEYGKGLETYLHDSFSVQLRNEIHGRYGTPVENIYWDGDQNLGIERIPFELKNVLDTRRGKTINLGAWKGLINDAFCSNIESINNPYIRDSYEFIRNFMSKEKWYTIAEACAVVSGYRNGDAHYGKRPLKDILMYREKIIEEINKVINAGASVWN